MESKPNALMLKVFITPGFLKSSGFVMMGAIRQFNSPAKINKSNPSLLDLNCGNFKNKAGASSVFACCVCLT